MEKNKKILLPILALNAIFSAHSGGASIHNNMKYDRIYNNAIKSIEQGKSDVQNYQVIEKVLKQRNKELRDLYQQNDYILKPEFLEWQIFFSGFYEEYGKGVDNSSGNAKYNSKITGYYDTNGNYIVTSGAGKPYQLLKEYKEIDLGIGIEVKDPEKSPVSFGLTKPTMPLIAPKTPANPMIDTITPVLPPMTSFDVPIITTPSIPTPVTVSAPSINAIVVENFTPVNPIVSTPSTFQAPLLDKVASGFGQETPMGINPEPAVAVGNASLKGINPLTTITTYNYGWNSSGPFNWFGSREWETANGSYSGGTTGTGSYQNTFLNALADSFYVQGNWEFINGTTGQTTAPSGNKVGAARFISVNHAFTSKGKTIVLNLDGDLNIKGREDGNEITVGIEHQAYDALHAEAKNNKTMTLESGKYLIGFNLIVEQKYLNSCYYNNSGNTALDNQCNPPGKSRTPELLSIKSTAENNGKIVINSENSIGIDFGQYSSFGEPMAIAVYSGDIEIAGKHNYGIRVPNVFAAVNNYYNETLISGITKNTVTSLGTTIPSHQGVITVGGEENVGISLSKKITGSTAVAGYQGLTVSDSSDLIGNIRNLSIKVDGDKTVGILRNSDYNNAMGGDIILKNTHISGNSNEGLTFGFNAKNSVLIRSDRYGMVLGRDLTVDASGQGDNTVMLANNIDSNNVKSKVINNTGNTLTLGSNTNKLTGLMSVNGAVSENKGAINIKGANSQGLVITNTQSAGGVISSGINSGNINLSGENSTGVYNAGTFMMSSGSIVAGAKNSIGVYAHNTSNTTLSGGNITSKNGGIALYSGNNSIINISGNNLLKAETGGLLFHNHMNSSNTITGKYNITGATTAKLESGGLLLYTKVNNLTDIPAMVGAIKNAFTNPGNLTVNMDSGSNIMYIDSPGGTKSINSFANVPDITTNFFNFSGTGYNQYVMSGYNLTLDSIQESNLDTGVYGRIQFINSDVTVSNGIDVKGTQTGQIAIAQKNIPGGLVTGRNITNNGNILLSGNKSTGMAGDFITMKNSGTGTIKSGENSVGMYITNGSNSLNQGLIELKAGSVGMYGKNDFGNTIADYGTRKINIENHKDIKTIAGGTSGNVFGIYADNALTLSDSSVNLTTSSNIDLKGTGTAIGVYLKKTDITNAGTIKIDSSGNSVGIYGDESTSTSITGNIDISGGSGTGIYLKNSNMNNGATITVNNVVNGIGIYVEGTTMASTGLNTNTILLGDNVTGMYGLGSSALNTGIVTNSGTIQSLGTSADKAIGMYIGTNGTGNNSGNIYLRAVGTNQNQVGVYNSGTFNMSGGDIEVFSKNGAGLYATGISNLSGGTIKTGDGAIGLYADGTTIKLSGTYKSIVENGGIFVLNNNGSGSIDVTNNIIVDVEAGGMAFSSTGPLSTYLNNLVTGGGTLEINLKDPTSKLAILDSPGVISLSSIGAAYAPGFAITPQVKISSSSNPNYTPFSIIKGTLLIDQSVNLNLSTDSYNKSDFINSSVDVNAEITGTNTGQLAVGQVNYGTGSSGTDKAKITLNNNSTIDLSGNNSTGMLADFGNITNTSGNFIKVTGEESVGIYAANGTEVTNVGTINIGNKSVGIYGVNQLLGTTKYGNGTININNNGNIISTGTAHGGYGIYVNNTTVPSTDSKISLGTGSNINISSGESGIGVYAVNSTLNIDGDITVGKNGIGIYANGSNGTIHGGKMNLMGDNAIGYYLTNSTALTNSGGSIHVDGQNITLMITDAGSSINLSTPFTVTSTPTSTYVVGNMTGGNFYNNTGVILGSNGSLVNGIGTVALFDTSSNISSTGTNVSGMVLSGQHVASISEEGTNLGIMSLGNSSAGIYLTGGARGRNEGTISINNNSVGIYAEGSGSHIINNNGIINIGQESTGLFLKDGVKIENTGTGEINSTNQNAVGMYSENSLTGASKIKNSNKIYLNGDQSIGIYTSGENNIINDGTILIGNSLSQIHPGIGVYTDSINSNIHNTALGTVNVGDNSIGVYNLNGNIINDGIITAGNGGIGIYSDGGTIALNNGSSITVGQNEAVGVYAVNQSGAVINNSSLTVGDKSYGFVFTGSTTPSFTNNKAAVIGNNSVFVLADSPLTADNNGTLTMTGSDNIGYYLKNGGMFVNNANIEGNTGVSNIGVYAKDTSIINNADIILGDSILNEHTNLDGTKYKTGYSVGIYGEKSNIANNAGHTIQVGKDGIGIYIKGTGYTAENYGTINGFGDNAKGIFATDYAVVKNYGTINMTGDNVIGIVGQNGAQIYNDVKGVINVTGNDVTGIYLAGSGTELINKGEINITGTGTGISYTHTVELKNITDTTGASQAYTSKQQTPPDMPTLINSGKINIIDVGENFNYDGIKVIVTIDPSTNTPTTNSSNQIGFGGVIPDRLEVAPDFSVGTASDRYIFENIFKGTTGKGDYTSQSLTWDATAQGSNLVMTRKAYTDFTDGLWYEDFGRELNEKYATTYGEGRKIYDKINYITNEGDFRHIMASLSGNIYANINQRENDIAKTLEDNLYLLQDSVNNTKENVKISVIGGKGKNKEETDGIVAYDYITTGILALREIERTYKHNLGYSLGYIHTNFDFKDGNESEEQVDTIQLGVHNKYSTDNWILKNDIMGRISIHNIDRNINWPSPLGRSEMNGNYETYSITSNNKLGREFVLGKRLSLTPYTALKAMYVTRPTFKENGLEKLEVDGNDAWSVKPKAGVELQTALPLGTNTAWQLKGTLDFAYEYELADLNTRERSKLASIEDGYHKLSKPEEEKGIFRTKASAGIEIKDRYGLFLTGEYKLSSNGDSKDDYRTGIILKAVF